MAMPKLISLQIRCIINEKEAKWKRIEVLPRRIVVEYIKIQLQLNGNLYYNGRNIDKSKKSFQGLGIKSGDVLEVRNYKHTHSTAHESVIGSQSYTEPLADNYPGIFAANYSPQWSTDTDSGGSNTEIDTVHQESNSIPNSTSLCISTELPATTCTLPEIPNSAPLPSPPAKTKSAAGIQASKQSPPISFTSLKRRGQYRKPQRTRMDHNLTFAYSKSKKSSLCLPSISGQLDTDPQCSIPWRVHTYLHTQVPELTAAQLPKIQRSHSFTGSTRSHQNYNAPDSTKLPIIPEKKRGKSLSSSLDLRSGQSGSQQKESSREPRHKQRSLWSTLTKQ